MSHPPGSDLPPYLQEYGKPTAYFDVGANFPTGGHPPYPSTHRAAVAGWHASPPMPFQPRPETSQRQQAEYRGGAALIDVTSPSAYFTSQQQQTVLAPGSHPSRRFAFLQDYRIICALLFLAVIVSTWILFI